MLFNCADTVKVPAIRICGNVISGNDSQTQAVLDCGVLEALVKLTKSKNLNIRKETYWTASNVAAGTQSQIQVNYSNEVYNKFVTI